MKRRLNILTMAAGAAMTLRSAHAAQTTRMNIVLVMADDVSPDMFSCYAPFTPHGMELASITPNIDRIASEGVAFKTAYASAMCAPSRAMIMTGKYGATTGVMQNAMWMGDSSENVYREHLAFGKMLSDAGYATAIAGKWHAGKQMPYEPEVGFQEYCLWEGAKEVLEVTGKELQKEGFEPVSNSHIVDAYQTLLNLPLERIQEIGKAKTDDYPILYKLVAKELTGKRGAEMLEKLLDRAYGKSIQRTDLTTGGDPLTDINIKVIKSREDE